MRDLFSNVKQRRAISPTRATDNTALAGQIIDTQGYDSLLFAISAGTLATAGATFNPSLTHGDAADLSDGTTVAATDLLGTIAGATFTGNNDDTTYKLGYKGNRRYVRLTITPASNSGNADISAIAILGHPSQAPVA